MPANRLMTPEERTKRERIRRRQAGRISVHLYARPGRVPELAVAATREALSWASSLGPAAGLRVATRRADADPEGLHIARMFGNLHPYDVAVDCWLPGTDLPSIEPMLGLRDRLDGLIVAPKCTVAAGPQFRFFGRGHLLSIDALITRREDLSHDDMLTYWHEQHTRLEGMPRFSANWQLHVDQELTEPVAARLDLPSARCDGMAEPGYRDLDHFYEAMMSPGMLAVAARDELHFIDHVWSSVQLVANHWIQDSPDTE